MVLYLMYLAGLAGLLAFLLSLEQVVGIPPRIREWMDPWASPGIALAGAMIGFPVVLLLMLPFLWNEVAMYIVWGGVYFSVIVIVGFLTARWWQPLYLATAIFLMFLVGGFFAGNTDDTPSDVVGLAFQTALVVGYLASLGALIRFTRLWLAGRGTSHARHRHVSA